jgi:hypothetical protein
LAVSEFNATMSGQIIELTQLRRASSTDASTICCARRFGAQP